MDELPADPRTAARIEAIRAACALPVAHVHGSLEGRADGEVLAAAIEPDGRHAALVLRDAVERWDLDALEPVGRWDAPPPGYVNHAACVAPAPGGLRVLCPDGLWRLSVAGDAWQMLAPLERVDTSVQPWGDVFAVWQGNATQVLRFADGAPCWAAQLRASLADVALSRDGRFLLRRVSATSFDVLEPVASRAGAPTELCTVARLATAAPAVRGVRVAAIDRERNLAAIATEGGVVVGRWDDWWSAATLAVGSKWPLRMEFTGDGRTLVLRERDRVLRVDVATGEVRPSRCAPPVVGKIAHAPLAASSGRVLETSRGGLHVLDEENDDFRTRAFDPFGEVICATGTPDGQALVTGADDGAVRVRDRATGEVLAQVEAGGAVVAVATSPDGREVTALRADGELSRYDRATGALVDRTALTLEFAPGTAAGLAVSPDGRLAVSGRASRPSLGVRVDLATGERRTLDALPGATGHVEDVAFTEDGAIRCVLGGASDEWPGELVCVEYAPGEGGARELHRRPLLDRDEVDAVDSLHHALSRDGRLLWRSVSIAAAGTTVTVVALDAPDHARTSWTIDAWHVAHCAGTALLAVATFDRALHLFAAHGAAARTPWPRGCVPLAFAPDDGALWVRDASGLVAELTVPAELRARSPPPRV